MDITFRPALVSDGPFLTEILVEAAFWRPDGTTGSVRDVLQTPELAHYISKWPQPGDLGVLAQTDQPVGAAWLRFFTAADPGYGFVDQTIPEVSIGVVREWRNKGVGRRLLETLITAARDMDIPALSLSVETDNYAYHLYERTGFQIIAELKGSVTMRLRL